MKKMIVLLMAMAVLVSTNSQVFAWDRGHHSRRHGGHHGGGHNRGGGDIWPIIGGAVIGAIIIDGIVDATNQRRYIPPPPPVIYYQPPPQVCFADVYGEWQINRYGNRYWEEYRRPVRMQVPCYGQ